MRANPRASKVLCSTMGTGIGRLIHVIYVYVRLQPCIGSCCDILDIGCGRAASRRYGYDVVLVVGTCCKAGDYDRMGGAGWVKDIYPSYYL